MDIGSWRAMVHRVARSQTRPMRLHTHTHTHTEEEKSCQVKGSSGKGSDGGDGAGGSCDKRRDLEKGVDKAGF